MYTCLLCLCVVLFFLFPILLSMFSIFPPNARALLQLQRWLIRKLAVSATFFPAAKPDAKLMLLTHFQELRGRDFFFFEKLPHEVLLCRSRYFPVLSSPLPPKTGWCQVYFLEVPTCSKLVATLCYCQVLCEVCYEAEKWRNS